MRLIELGDGAPITLDRCSKNHGLWFDRGELDRVIDHLDSHLRAPLAKRLRSIFGK